MGRRANAAFLVALAMGTPWVSAQEKPKSEDVAMEQYYCAEAEECAHCGNRTTHEWKDSLAYFVLGIAVSICLHSARV